jgi:hypothetical protein
LAPLTSLFWAVYRRLARIETGKVFNPQFQPTLEMLYLCTLQPYTLLALQFMINSELWAQIWMLQLSLLLCGFAGACRNFCQRSQYLEWNVVSLWAQDFGTVPDLCSGRWGSCGSCCFSWDIPFNVCHPSLLGFWQDPASGRKVFYWFVSRFRLETQSCCTHSPDRSICHCAIGRRGVHIWWDESTEDFCPTPFLPKHI